MLTKVKPDSIGLQLNFEKEKLSDKWFVTVSYHNQKSFTWFGPLWSLKKQSKQNKNINKHITYVIFDFELLNKS